MPASTQLTTGLAVYTEKIKNHYYVLNKK